jgi:hypothetical protein
MLLFGVRKETFSRFVGYGSLEYHGGIEGVAIQAAFKSVVF